MKTRTLLLIATALLAACNGDNSNQNDGGPHNGQDAAPDNTQPPMDSGPGNDGGTCSTGLSFDNTLVPGWPNSIPQP